MHTTYMRAAGKNGIPTAFIVGTNGNIEWIGHPLKMDQILARLIAGESVLNAPTFQNRQNLKGRHLSEEIAQPANTTALEKLGAKINPHPRGGGLIVELGGTQVTDAGLVHLTGLTKLEELHIPGTQITDAGLVHLKGLTNLKGLDLGGTQVTDAGLVHLKGLTNLKWLNLNGTQVTDAGVAELKKALPKCNIGR